MRKKLITLMLVFAACFVLTLTFAGATSGAASQKPAEVPEWASVLPAKTTLVVAIEDLESFRAALFPPDPSKAEFPSVERVIAIISEVEPKAGPPLRAGAKSVNTLLSAFEGDFSLGMGQTPVWEWPTFFFVGNLKPEVEDFAQYFTRSVAPLGLKPVLGKEQGVDRLDIGELVLYFTTADSTLMASTDLKALLRMKKGNLPSESTLAGQQSFRKAIAIAPPKGLFLFMDLKRFGGLHSGSFSAGTWKALSNLGLDRLESLALSADIDGSSLKMDLALTSAGEFTGVPAILLRANTETKAASFVPSDYSVFLRLNIAGADDAYREWQAMVRRMTDDVSWKEYQDALAKLETERGFGLEDILENLGDEIALAVKLPELPGIPPTLAFIAVKDEAKALDAISSLLTRVESAPQFFTASHGYTIYTTSLVPGVLLSYAVSNGYLVVGLSPSSVGSALAASSSGKSLVQEPNFASVATGLPRENLFLAYVDMQRAARFAANSIPVVSAVRSATYSISHMFTPSSKLDPNLTKGTPSPGSVKLIQKLYLQSERMGKAVVCITSGNDYLSVRAELPIGIMGWVASFLTEPLARARESARRTNCMHNLKQIMIACHTYAADHKDKFPDRLSELHPHVGSLDVFCCPSTGVVVSRPEDIDSMSSYKLIGGFVLKEVKETGKKLVLYESLENHGDGANVAFADGHCMWVKPERLRELLKEAGQ